MPRRSRNQDSPLRLSLGARTEIRKLAAFSKSSFGTRRSGPEYEESIRQSVGRYTQLREQRNDFFAFIMPAGHGKTTIARKYGFLDVDELVDVDEHEQLAVDRTAILAGKTTWTEHNVAWLKRVSQTLDLLDYSMPVIILVHTEEIALELGARPIGYFRLTPHAFAKNISRRTPLQRTFSQLNYDTCSVSRSVPNQIVCNSSADIEKSILEVLNLSGMPVAAPFRYSEGVWNRSYSKDVPMWILKGDIPQDSEPDVNRVFELFEEGKVPKEAVDYFVGHSYVPAQFDFGVTMYHWSQFAATIPPTMNKRQDFDVNGDMMKIFPPSSSKELTRANITVRQLITTFDIFSHPEALEIARYHVGEPQTFVASILSAWKGIIQHTRVAEVLLPWFKVGFKNWSKVMKQLHSYIRTSRYFMNISITERERQSLMYMDLLVGRNEYTIDELAEVRVRSADTFDTRHLSFDPYLKVYTNKQYKEDFAEALDHAYMRVKCNPRKVNFSSFKDFYARRATWVTKGGLVSNKLPAWAKKYSASVFESVSNVVTEIEGRHNKKSLFETRELFEIMVGTNRENFNVTKTMIKYETGRKDRTLLPGSLMHFIVFCYVLVLAEKQEQVGSVRSGGMSDGDVRFFDRKMSHGLFHILYDWADFNEQHSVFEMQAVIKKLTEVVPAPTDYVMFCDAIISGFMHMRLEDRTGKVHKLMRGLYSGWRGTTYLNCVLNFVYVYVGLRCVERVWGYTAVLMVDHGGDDLDLIVSDPNVMTVFMQVMDKMLFKANPWKQMFGKRSEFFRNTISGHTVYASPTRALSAFIAGDWEGAGRATVRERVTGLLDQIGKLRRRGVDEEMCQGFAMATVAHWCKVKDGDEWTALPKTVIHGQESQGGLGVPDADGHVWVLNKDIPEVDDKWYQVVVPGYKASKDYVGVLATELERFCLTISRQEELAKKLAESSYDVEFTLDRISWNKMLEFDGVCIDTKPVVLPAVDDDVFDRFCNFTISDEDEKLFGQAARYQEYIGYIQLNGKDLSKEELMDAMSDGQVPLEAVEFSGDMHYMRLVPEFIASRAIMFSKMAIAYGNATTAQAEYMFRVNCWMSKTVFGHMI